MRVFQLLDLAINTFHSMTADRCCRVHGLRVPHHLGPTLVSSSLRHGKLGIYPRTVSRFGWRLMAFDCRPTISQLKFVNLEIQNAHYLFTSDGFVECSDVRWARPDDAPPDDSPHVSGCSVGEIRAPAWNRRKRARSLSAVRKVNILRRTVNLIIEMVNLVLFVSISLLIQRADSQTDRDKNVLISFNFIHSSPSGFGPQLLRSGAMSSVV